MKRALTKVLLQVKQATLIDPEPRFANAPKEHLSLGCSICSHRRGEFFPCDLVVSFRATLAALVSLDALLSEQFGCQQRASLSLAPIWHCTAYECCIVLSTKTSLD